MADIKLYYFNARVRAEFIRLALLAADQPFEDIRITGNEWTPELKAEAPFRQLPLLKYKGKNYGQSVALGNFVAREFNLYGKTNLDALRIDEVMQLAEDYKAVLVDWVHEEDGAKKAEYRQKLKDELSAKFLGFFEELLRQNGDSGFFVGNAVTLADLVVYDVADATMVFDPKAVEDFPNVKKLRSNVEAIPAIKSYLADRPQTDI